ncbi:hypothetical protein OAH01_02280 [Akkermansiaceae bacterium]|nr:hypothetical protein [Akkermansiaceae bacterium]
MKYQNNFPIVEAVISASSRVGFDHSLSFRQKQTKGCFFEEKETDGKMSIGTF